MTFSFQRSSVHVLWKCSPQSSRVDQENRVNCKGKEYIVGYCINHYLESDGFMIFDQLADKAKEDFDTRNIEGRLRSESPFRFTKPSDNDFGLRCCCVRFFMDLRPCVDSLRVAHPVCKQLRETI